MKYNKLNWICGNLNKNSFDTENYNSIYGVYIIWFKENSNLKILLIGFGRIGLELQLNQGINNNALSDYSNKSLQVCYSKVENEIDVSKIYFYLISKLNPIIELHNYLIPSEPLIEVNLPTFEKLEQ